MSNTKIKICGITTKADALHAVECGADALGFVLWDKSPRAISPETVSEITAALPPFITTVGVFVDESVEGVNKAVRLAGLDSAQLHGDELPEYCKLIDVKVIKAIRVKGEGSLEGIADYNVSAFLLDTYSESAPGGTGRTFDWRIAGRAKDHGPVILSGGLNPHNVAEAVGIVKPYGVDVSSGVEKEPGVKDPDKVREFIETVRGVK